MANRICIPMTEVPEYLVANIKVPAGVTLQAGDVVIADAIDSSISGNYSVYAAEKPATAKLGSQMAIVINGGFETLADGRRPEGQPDFTKYEFKEGDIATVIFLAPQMRFQISFDSIDATPSVGDFAFPVDNSFKMSSGASTPVGTFSSLKLVAEKSFRLGGNNGAGFAVTFVATVQNPA